MTEVNTTDIFDSLSAVSNEWASAFSNCYRETTTPKAWFR